MTKTIEVKSISSEHASSFCESLFPEGSYFEQDGNLCLVYCWNPRNNSTGKITCDVLYFGDVVEDWEFEEGDPDLNPIPVSKVSISYEAKQRVIL